MTILASDLRRSAEWKSFIGNETEIEACSQDVMYFLSRYAWIQNKNTAQMVKWESWPYLCDLLDIFTQNKEVIIVKARQLGITWLIGLYCGWKGLFNESAKIVYISQGEIEAWDILTKTRFLFDHLPDCMKLFRMNDTRSWMSFPISNTEFRTLPSTEKAGRGTDATVIVRDECAYHPYADENFASISPAIDSGGQLIDLSTMDRMNPDNHFAQRVKRAYLGATKTVMPSGLEVYRGGESGAVLVFLNWRLRPMRQEGMSLDEWYERIIKIKYSAAEREKEYPETLSDALRPSAARAFFDLDSVEEGMMQICNPIHDFKGFDTWNGLVRVYKPPVVGRRYCAFTDPSNGIEDPFVTIVKDAASGEWVCTATGRKSAQEVGQIHDQLVRAYNNAYNTGEANAQAGGTFIDTLIALETPNIAPRRDKDNKIIQGKIGWWSGGGYLRDKALHDLKEAVRKQLITVHDREFWDECQSFALDEAGKLRAVGMAHDDWILSGAGVEMIAKYMPMGHYEIQSTKYRS